MTEPEEHTKPTQAQIYEAQVLQKQFGVNPFINSHDLARLIAHIRREARNAALEEAAERAFDYITLWAPLQHSKDFADSIRALKDQP